MTDVVLVTHNLLRNNNYLTFADDWEEKLEVMWFVAVVPQTKVIS